MFFLGAACVDLSLSLLRIASMLHVQQSSPNVPNFLPITCNLLPYVCCIVGKSFATYLDNIWDMVAAVPSLHEDCQAIAFYNALVAMGNISYILPECINEHVCGIFAKKAHPVIQLCLT